MGSRKKMTFVNSPKTQEPGFKAVLGISRKSANKQIIGVHT